MASAATMAEVALRHAQELESLKRRHERELERYRATWQKQADRIKELERKVGELQLDLDLAASGFRAAE